MTQAEGRAVPVRLDAARCPKCDTCINLDPLLVARDLAIVSALIQELGIEEKVPRNVKELVDKLARKSVTLNNDIAFYGYDFISEEEE